MTMGSMQTCSVGTALSTCPIDYWCHVGPDASTTICCPNGLNFYNLKFILKKILANSNLCRLPMLTGDGLANLERYYYDFASKTCRLFYYRGFKGNQNNFLTIVKYLIFFFLFLKNLFFSMRANFYVNH